MENLDFLDFAIYYPDRIPWMGKCELISLDKELGVVSISNGTDCVEAKIGDLLWCPYTGGTDKPGSKVYKADMLKGANGIVYVASERDGKFVLNRLPDGGDIDIPIKYARYLTLVGSLHDSLEYKWLKEIINDIHNLGIEFEPKEATGVDKSYCEIRLEGFAIKVRSTLSGYITATFLKEYSEGASVDTQLKMRKSHIQRLLEQVGNKAMVSFSANNKVVTWEVFIVVGQYKHLVSDNIILNQ